MASPLPQNMQRGIVKQVQSGDSVVIRGQPKGGPPPERILSLSNITAPRLARRANPASEGSVETNDEPFAWQAREFLRKKLIGKEVSFSVEYKVPGTGREYGCIYLGTPGKDSGLENVTETLVAEGLVEVRRGGLKPNDENQQRLIQIEESAKASGKGRWIDGTKSEYVRNITWTIENPRHYVDAKHQKPISAVIEHVRDGCTVRAFVLPTFDYITVMLSGIKCPMFKLEGTAQVPEPFAEEAKFFTESRLLQRDIQIILEGVSNQNFLGTVLHPNGNIAELLLREGLARCVDWSMGVVTQGADKLRAAERSAKESKKRLWKDYQQSHSAIEVKDKTYSGKVVEVGNGDSMVIKTADGAYKKIFLASVRPPRMPADAVSDGNKKVRPLYDIPYMFEAREFLRKRLIGKKVNVQVDYIQKASQGFPEKTCCTVTIGGINVAETLIGKGLATCVRYAMDNDQRSSHYDELLAAETQAQKSGARLHSKKDAPIHRVADTAGDIAKAKQFLPFLQRAGKSEAIVEYVTSGSRLRLYLPRETCLITFLLSGIDCPRGARPGQGVTSPPSEASEKCLMFTKEMCMQREVEVTVEAIDRGGNFIGWMFIDDTNMSVALVSEGMAKVHFTAERSPYYKALCAAEEKAKAARINLWADYEEPKESEIKEETTERKVNYKTLLVTEVCDDGHFYAQFVDNGPQLEKMMEDLREDLDKHPPLPGAYHPKRGDLCAAKFSDGQWYRAKVTKVAGMNSIHILYIDYGNSEVSDSSKLATLPAGFVGIPAQSQEFALACIALPSEEDQKNDAVDALYNDLMNKQFLMNFEYKSNGVDHITLVTTDNKDDMGQSLVAEGLVSVETRREKRLMKLMADYLKAQEKAKKERLNLWRYGDFTEDDAKEFGFNG